MLFHLVLIGLCFLCQQTAIASKRSCLFRSLDQKPNEILRALQVGGIEQLNNPANWQTTREHFIRIGMSQQKILMMHDHARIRLLVYRGATRAQIDSLIEQGVLILHRHDRLESLIKYYHQRKPIGHVLSATNINRQLATHIKNQKDNSQKLLMLSNKKLKTLVQLVESRPQILKELEKINTLSWDAFLARIDALMAMQKSGKVLGLEDQLELIIHELKNEHFIPARNRIYELVEAHRLQFESQELVKPNAYLIMNLDGQILSLNNRMSKNFDVIIVVKEADQFVLKYASDSKNIFSDSIGASQIRTWAEKMVTYESSPNKVTNISVYLDVNGKYMISKSQFDYFIREFELTQFNEVRVYNQDTSFRFRLLKEQGKTYFEFGANRKKILVRDTSIEHIFHLAFPEAPYTVTQIEWHEIINFFGFSSHKWA